MAEPSAPPPSYDAATGEQKFGMGQPTTYGTPTGYGQPGYGPGYPPAGGYAQPTPAGYSQPSYQGPFQNPTSPPAGTAGYAPPPQQAYNMPTHPYSSDWQNADTEAGRGMNVQPSDSGGNQSDEPVWDTGTFSDKAVRRGFIRKVLLILMLQLAVTFGIILVFVLVEPIQRWIRGPGSWFYYVAYAAFFITYIAMVCIQQVRRTFPGNFIALAIFTLAFSYMCGTISSYYDIQAVLVAAGITAAVCLALALFASQTKIDFTVCSGLLCALVLVLFFFGWACMITWFVSYETAKILQCVYGALGALVMSLFLVYDIQMLMGGRKYELSPEEYIFASVQIYLDVVYIFLFILMIFGGGKK